MYVLWSFAWKGERDNYLLKYHQKLGKTFYIVSKEDKSSLFYQATFESFTIIAYSFFTGVLPFSTLMMANKPRRGNKPTNFCINISKIIWNEKRKNIETCPICSELFGKLIPKMNPEGNRKWFFSWTFWGGRYELCV